MRVSWLLCVQCIFRLCCTNNTFDRGLATLAFRTARLWQAIAAAGASQHCIVSRSGCVASFWPIGALCHCGRVACGRVRAGALILCLTPCAAVASCAVCWPAPGQVPATQQVVLVLVRYLHRTCSCGRVVLAQVQGRFIQQCGRAASCASAAGLVFFHLTVFQLAGQHSAELSLCISSGGCFVLLLLGSLAHAARLGCGLLIGTAHCRRWRCCSGLIEWSLLRRPVAAKSCNACS